jgi:hypothetical protein
MLWKLTFSVDSEHLVRYHWEAPNWASWPWESYNRTHCHFCCKITSCWSTKYLNFHYPNHWVIIVHTPNQRGHLVSCPLTTCCGSSKRLGLPSEITDKRTVLSNHGVYQCHMGKYHKHLKGNKVSLEMCRTVEVILNRILSYMHNWKVTWV